MAAILLDRRGGRGRPPEPASAVIRSLEELPRTLPP
jgi:hypothetical protein